MSNENPWDHFIGQFVHVIETHEKYNGKDYISHSIDQTDSVYLAFKKAASEYSIRVWFPNTLGTCDFNPNRINLSLKKKDNQYYIDDINFG